MSGPAELRVPREHGAVLAVPPLSEVGRLLDVNTRRLHFKQPWQDLRDAARREAVAAAREYLTSLGEPLPEAGGELIIAAGHQPELFHPGVWLKSFALHGIARRHGGVALNLIVDNDGVKSPSLVVPRVRIPLPAVDEFRAHVEPIAFDAIALGTPYEEWTVRDEKLFDSLPERVRADWPFEPLLRAYWDEVRKVARRTASVPARLTGARRAIERLWGCHNLELPVNQLCRPRPFTVFAFHLLDDLPRFHAVYNECLRDYRRAHGLKSRNHPAPDLTTDGDWLEAPFWAWRKGDSRRGRVFARHASDGSILLRALGQEWLGGVVGTRPSRIERTWHNLELAGLKIRKRALTTTLFVRLFVADLFIHGIGGARYDVVTDNIIRRYWGIEPPAFLILSGTMLPPFPSYATTIDDCRRLASAARDIHYNPQRHLPEGAGSDVGALAARREALVRHLSDDPTAKKHRWRELQAATAALRPYVGGTHALALERLRRCMLELDAQRILASREYAFCLHPEAELRPFCSQFL